MNWFERITGFKEESYAETKAKLEARDRVLYSKVNDRSFGIGQLELVSLAELRERASQVKPHGRLTVINVRGDVRRMHQDAKYAGALFQVASQFNLLEMVGPDVTPEDGVTRYQHDATQGPACAIAAGAATIYRNYFVPVGDQLGQSRDRQLDGLADLGEALSLRLATSVPELWKMRNGYALATREGLHRIRGHLTSASEPELETLRGLLRIGLHTDVEVTDCDQTSAALVSQAFCSALPVRYSALAASEWEPFARLVLEAAYEATLLAGLLNSARGASRKVLLTQLGGGAFGNEPGWILDAIRRALTLFSERDLEVNIVSYGMPHPSLLQLEKTFAAEVR
jgi:hypothetical protein